MKDCKKIHPLLSLYAEDALSAREKTRVEKHVSGCPVAREELEHWNRFKKTMRIIPEPKTPHDLHERIMAHVQGREPLPSRSGLTFRYLWPLAAAACIALFLYIKNPNWLETSNPVASLPQPTQVVAMKPVLKTPIQAVNRVSRLESKNSAVRDFSLSTNSDASLENQQLAMASPKKMTRVPRNRMSSMVNNQGININLAPAGAVTQGGLKAENLVVASAQSAPPVPAALAAAPAIPTPTPTAQGVPIAETADQTIQTWNGDFSPVTVESQLLITDAQTFQNQWDNVQQGQALPTVDFTTQAVVFLTAGNEPTTGYSIHVSKLEEQADQWVVHYQVVAPAPGAVTGQMFTRPWSMQAIPKPTKPVTFLKDQ